MRSLLPCCLGLLLAACGGTGTTSTEPVQTTTGSTSNDTSTSPGSGGDTASNPGTPPPASCTPSCGGRQCGSDGCGGSCGACGSGTACTTSGVCVVPSLNCGAGQQCMYTEYTAWEYRCPTSDYCERTGAVLGVYGDPWFCKVYACQGGNSTCGDQNGNFDELRLACEYCKNSCYEPTGVVACHSEAPPSPAGAYCNLTDSAGRASSVPCTCR